MPKHDNSKLQDKLARLENKEKQARLKLARALNEVKYLREYNDRISANIPTSLLIFDKNLSVVFANERFCRCMHMERDRVIGKKLESLFPASIYKKVGLGDKITAVWKSGLVSDRECMHLKGETYYYRIVPLKHVTPGTTNAMLIMEDVTEIEDLSEKLHASEERYKNVFEKSADGILISSFNFGRILESNEMAQKITGYKKNELERNNVFDLFATDEKDRLLLSLDKLSNDGEEEIDDLKLMRKNRQERIVSLSARPIRYGGERIIQWIIKDETEKKYYERQIKQSEKMAILGQFTAGAAHEINNPLSIISANIQFLLSNIEDGNVTPSNFKEVIETLKILDRETKYCGSITSNLLRFSHEATPEKYPIDINSYIRETLELVEHQMNLSNVSVSKDLGRSLTKALASPSELRHVFMNLIMNALYAMHKGGKLFIRTFQVGPEKIGISLRDTGAGISSKNIDNIFMPFFTTKDVGKGIGLGLWVVHSIITEHNGEIEVSSKVGKGTTFTIKLPAVPKGAKGTVRSVSS